MNYEKRLDQLAALEPNWDSYGSPAIDHVVLERVRLLLKWSPDWIVPTPSGGLEVQWFEGKAHAVPRLAIEFIPGGNVMAEVQVQPDLLGVGLLMEITRILNESRTPPEKE